MAKLKARMESAQHILHHILAHECNAEQTGMQIYENKIRLDVRCSTNLMAMPKKEFENGVNKIIQQNLPVTKIMYNREEAPDGIDISMVPPRLKEIRIVAIGDFDIQPCGNPHVNNTSEIGKYRILEIKRKGKDVYRIVGVVED